MSFGNVSSIFSTAGKVTWLEMKNETTLGEKREKRVGKLKVEAVSLSAVL